MTGRQKRTELQSRTGLQYLAKLKNFGLLSQREVCSNFFFFFVGHSSVFYEKPIGMFSVIGNIVSQIDVSSLTGPHPI